MGRLKSALMSKYSSQKDRVKIFNPRNCEQLNLYFKGEKIAKVFSFPSGYGLII
jgi:cleavage and polyadenylation specificity factor subunit 3